MTVELLRNQWRMLGHWKKLCPWYFSLAQETTYTWDWLTKLTQVCRGTILYLFLILGDFGFSEFSFWYAPFWTLVESRSYFRRFLLYLAVESYVELMNKDSGKKLAFLNIHWGLNLWKEMTLRNDILFSKRVTIRRWMSVVTGTTQDNQRHQCLCPWSQANKYQVRTKEHWDSDK